MPAPTTAAPATPVSRLLDPVALGPRRAANRVLLGPHVTNLGDDDRRLTDRHLAYYRRRAVGGCGTIVVEEASVHDSDWPYERAPLAERCPEGWARIAVALHDEGALAVAALGHAGGQGSSAYSQRALWAPSRVPEVNTREVPKWMEAEDIAAVVAGFATSAALAASAGLDGVEVNAGQHSLVRQFLSGLTNHRGDEWGADRLRFARDVLVAVRAGLGTDRVLGVRLSGDELAPWAGITAEHAPVIAAELAEAVDYLVVVRGAIYSAEKTRPDFHEPTGFNLELCRAVRQAVPACVAVVLQGSVVDVAQAASALEDGAADAVEMTRAQIADPDLVAKLRAGSAERIRPCIRCNQTCQVRDARNPIVTCVGEPTSGRETEDPDWYAPTSRPRDVLVVGAGPAGLETARVAAIRGHRARVVEAADGVGGMAAIAGPGGPLVDWLAAELERLGVLVERGTTGWAVRAGEVVVQCTGSRRGEAMYEIVDNATVLDVAEVCAGTTPLPGTGRVVLLDPIGGPIAVALAETLGERAVLVTQDNIAGNELSRTGDLAPANVRLQQRGVDIERRTIPRCVRPTASAAAGEDDRGLEVEVEDRFSGTRRVITAAAVVDCGFRLPDTPLPGVTLRAGDCIAPRTIHEAILEGRRAALAL
jgi:mycofactocin system FadH/OYE family oxidoreductase 1